MNDNNIKIKSSTKNILKREILTENDKILSSNKDVIKIAKLKMKNSLITKKTEDILFKTKDKINQLSIDSEFEVNDENRIWGVIAYIFAPIIYIFKIDSKYVLEHARRGLFLFYIEVFYIILYQGSKQLIKTPTSCNNFIHYNFIDGCKATPWWVDFIWGIIALIIVFIVVKCITRVLKEQTINEKEVKFN